MLAKKLKFQEHFQEALKGFMGSKEDFKNYCLKNLNNFIETPNYDALKAISTSLSNSSSDPEDTIPSISQEKQAIVNIEKNNSILQESIIGKVKLILLI